MYVGVFPVIVLSAGAFTLSSPTSISATNSLFIIVLFVFVVVIVYLLFVFRFVFSILLLLEFNTITGLLLVFTIIIPFISMWPFSVVVIVILYNVTFLSICIRLTVLLKLNFLLLSVPVICICPTVEYAGNKLPSASKYLEYVLSSIVIRSVSGLLLMLLN